MFKRQLTRLATQYFGSHDLPGDFRAGQNVMRKIWFTEAQAVAILPEAGNSQVPRLRRSTVSANKRSTTDGSTLDR